MKEESGGQFTKEFVGLRAKAYSYLEDKNNEDKKVKTTKICLIKRNFKIIKAVQKQLSLKLNKSFRKK